MERPDAEVTALPSGPSCATSRRAFSAVLVASQILTEALEDDPGIEQVRVSGTSVALSCMGWQ